MNEVLIAGIGNIFLGDDAFGVETVRHLARFPLPDGVAVRDFGIRGYDLALALDSARTVILVDATARGEAPGTLYTIELAPEDDGEADTAPDAHAMTPAAVLRMARQWNIQPGRMLLVGCEPATFGREQEGQMGLSAPVAEAAERAAALIAHMVSDLCAGAGVPAAGAV